MVIALPSGTMSENNVLNYTKLKRVRKLGQVYLLLISTMMCLPKDLLASSGAILGINLGLGADLFLGELDPQDDEHNSSSFVGHLRLMPGIIFNSDRIPFAIKAIAEIGKRELSTPFRYGLQASIAPTGFG